MKINNILSPKTQQIPIFQNQGWANAPLPPPPNDVLVTESEYCNKNRGLYTVCCLANEARNSTASVCEWSDWSGLTSRLMTDLSTRRMGVSRFCQ